MEKKENKSDIKYTLLKVEDGKAYVKVFSILPLNSKTENSAKFAILVMNNDDKNRRTVTNFA